MAKITRMPTIGLAPCHSQSQFSKGLRRIQKSWVCNFSEARSVSQVQNLEKEIISVSFS